MDHRYVDDLPYQPPSIETVINFPRPLFYFLFRLFFQKHNLDGTITVRTVERSLECERDLLTDGDEEAKGRVLDILTTLGVPCYRTMVDTFTAKLMSVYGDAFDIKGNHCIKMKVMITVPVEEFPVEPIGYHESVIRPHSRGPRTPEVIELHLAPTTRCEAGAVCAVCQQSLLQDYNSCVRMPTCPHFFHRGCIEPWLRTDGVCPNCRAPFPI